MEGARERERRIGRERERARERGRGGGREGRRLEETEMYIIHHQSNTC